MKKRLVVVFVFLLMITGCGNADIVEKTNRADDSMTENTDPTDTEETTSAEGVADYPAAVMVNDTIYLVGGTPMSEEVGDSAIIGYTESFTDTFPENNGETNFNPELGMPYAQVEGGIAVFYENEWYLCTPYEMEIP